MNEIPFRLEPFPGGPQPPFEVEGGLLREKGQLGVRFRLQGPLGDLNVPPPAPRPERRDGLWRGTCFEVFLAAVGQPGYLELNVSPCGCWNLYSFAGYRKGVREEAAIESLPVERTSPRRDVLEVTAVLPLGDLLPEKSALEIGVSAVLAATEGELSYWALAHPGRKPDFHLREGFTLRL